MNPKYRRYWHDVSVTFANCYLYLDIVKDLVKATKSTDTEWTTGWQSGEEEAKERGERGRERMYVCVSNVFLVIIKAKCSRHGRATVFIFQPLHRSYINLWFKAYNDRAHTKRNNFFFYLPHPPTHPPSFWQLAELDRALLYNKV